MKLLLLLASPMLWGAEPTDTSSRDQEPRAWYRRHLVGMEVGPTGAQFGHSDPTDTRYARFFDGAKIVRECRNAGAEYLVLWVRDGDYAYYNSKILPKAPGLLDRDPLREALTEARSTGMPLIAYCVVQQGGHFLKAHPEWEMKGPDGQPIARFCYNSGYLEAMKQIVAEQLAYGIDGFHIDMVDQGFGPPYGCWCDTCRRLFEAEHHQPMPTGPTWDAAWKKMLEFRYRTSERFEKELAGHIRSLNPRTTVDFNYHGNPPFSFEVGQRPVQHAGNGDFVTGETGVWGFSSLGVGFNAEFYRASTPGLPYQVAMQRGVRMYHDQTTRPLVDMAWELKTLLAHGAFVTMVDKTSFDGRLDPLAYERFQELFRDALARREHFGHAPVQEVGLYYSSASRDWIGRTKPESWMQSILGGHKACVFEHIPFGILLDENLSREQLEKFPAVLLPNVGILSPKEVSLFRHYVEQGGRLIVTGQSAQFNELGEPAPHAAFEELIGATVVERSPDLDVWIKFPKEPSHPLTSETRPDWPFLVKGPATVYKPTSATPVGELIKPHRTHRQREGKEGTDWPMSPDVPVGPAILVRTLGKGKVVTFAGSPDFATASEHHIVETRKLLARAITWEAPVPPVRLVEAPTGVEVVVTDHPDTRTLRVHLLAYLSPPQTTPATNRPFVLPTPLENHPMYRFRLIAYRPIQSVRLLDSKSRWEQKGNEIEGIVEGVHEVIVIQY